MQFGKVTIVGVGLIGGAIGLALRTRGLAEAVWGLGRDTPRLEEAAELGILDGFSTDPVEALAGAGVVVVCTPVDAVAKRVVEAALLTPPDALITDVGSTKASIVAAAESDLEACRKFVGAHPIAGSERSGARHARADLFEKTTCVLTPVATTSERCLALAESFWSALGCTIRRMSPQQHDEALAAVSHLPHAIASALTHAAPSKYHELAGGAFRDMTRVAAADPELWSAIFLQNREQLLDALSLFENQIALFRNALTDHDLVAIREWYSAARQQRSALNSCQASTP